MKKRYITPQLKSHITKHVLLLAGSGESNVKQISILSTAQNGLYGDAKSSQSFIAFGFEDEE